MPAKEMVGPRSVEIYLEAQVQVTINDPDVVERVTGLNGDEWRKSLYNLFSIKDVLDHLAYNCLVNGVTEANKLDGWADLSDDAATMHVGEVRPT